MGWLFWEVRWPCFPALPPVSHNLRSINYNDIIFQRKYTTHHHHQSVQSKGKCLGGCGGFSCIDYARHIDFPTRNTLWSSFWAAVVVFALVAYSFILCDFTRKFLLLLPTPLYNRIVGGSLLWVCYRWFIFWLLFANKSI